MRYRYSLALLSLGHVQAYQVIVRVMHASRIARNRYKLQARVALM